MQHYDDPDLVSLFSRGNKQAFEIIYRRYHRRLYFMAMKYLKNRDLSEDAVQDIFLKLWETRKKLDPQKSVSKFLFTCLKNHIMNMIRNQKNKLLEGYEMKQEMVSEETDILDELYYSECKNAVQNGLSGLSERKRKVFELKVFGGFSNLEVANKLCISINTVKVHYYCSSQHIKSFLNKYSGLFTEKKIG